jgi:hypothetical protein
MNQSCPGWRGDIGAYIVGALDPEAGVRLRRHLRRCRACRHDYTDLVPVRDWLRQLATSEGVPAAPATLAYRPLEPVQPFHSWWRRWPAISGIAAASVAAASALVVHLSVSAAAPAYSGFDRATGVHGQARLRTTTTGTQIDLSVSGLRPGQRCVLIAVSPAGASAAGTWTAAHDGSAHITGISAIPAAQLTALRIETPADQVLLSIHP